MEFVSEKNGVVRIKLLGSCGSCPSSSVTLKNAVEDALFEAAPDIVEIIADKDDSRIELRRGWLF